MLRKSQKQSREDLRRKNFKRVCEELNKVGELLREVLNVRSSAKLDMLCLANASCRNSGPVILWVRHISFTCIDKRHITLVQGWHSLVFDKSRLNAHAQSKQMYVALLPAYPCTVLKQTNTVKTGIPWTSFKMTPVGVVKWTLHV